MVRQMHFPLQIVGCPIVREADGLALSSRNKRLTPEQRTEALQISQTHRIAQAPGLTLEYFELVDGNTLQSIADWKDTTYPVGCITVFCGEVRLIDNIKY